jgi:hypothetical protein
MPDAFERVLDRRDRKRRNQRIVAGVVGIAAFVAAVWIVTSGLSLDRREKSVAPAAEVTGPAETAPPPARASAAPDVARNGPCSGGIDPELSIWRLQLTDVGDKIRVRFVVDPAWEYSWRIVLRHGRAGPDPFDYGDGRVFFEGTRSDAGCCNTEIAVQRSVRDREVDDGFAAKAVDQQRGQVCKGLSVIQE